MPHGPASLIALKNRYFIDMAFKGTAYHGWQSQSNAGTVQASLEEGLFRITGEAIRTVGAGRTDTGVHARSFTVHFDASSGLFDDTKDFLYKINSVLPSDIAVFRIRSVTGTAHARFSALSRIYEYVISRKKNPFMTEYSWLLTKPLDLKAMNEASSLLLGRHDFTSFSKLHSNNRTNLCMVLKAGWREENDDQVIFRIEADRFLRNMVRSIVGNLVMLGSGKIRLQQFAHILESRDRSLAKGTAPAEGLSLVQIIYPSEIYL